MRLEVIKTIYQAAVLDKNIIFITGDLGHAHQQDFEKNLPDQYINAGIAEQNIISIAAGLALSGNRVFVYSIAPFITMRCYEQIKVDVCYQNVGVVVIGVGAGYAYSTCGGTHHAIEDIAIMRALPNMHIFSPSNPFEARLITQHLVHQSYPAYLRIGKGGESNTNQEYPISINLGSIRKIGQDITICSTGSIVNEALAAANILEEYGISTEVISIHTLKPLDNKLIEFIAKNRKAVFVLEEHNIMGGLGEAIARVICELDIEKKIIFKCFGIPDQYNHLAGTQKFMRGYYKLNAEDVAKEIIKLYKKA